MAVYRAPDSSEEVEHTAPLPRSWPQSDSKIGFSLTCRQISVAFLTESDFALAASVYSAYWQIFSH